MGLLSVAAVLVGILTMHAMSSTDMPMAATASSSVSDQVVTTAVADSMPLGTTLSSFEMLCILGILAIVVILLLVRASTLRLIVGRLARRLRLSASKLTFPDPPSLYALSISRT